MLVPKRVKHRKVQHSRMKGKATRGNSLVYGDLGVQATTCGRIISNQIEAVRIAINRYIRRGGKFWIKIFPDKPVAKKSAETRTGSGRGSVEYWVVVVKPSGVLFELSRADEEKAGEAVRLTSHKLSIGTKSATRRGFEEVGGEE